ncbi:unnamed protein product [Brassica oleracea]
MLVQHLYLLSKLSFVALSIWDDPEKTLHQNGKQNNSLSTDNVIHIQYLSLTGIGKGTFFVEDVIFPLQDLDQRLKLRKSPISMNQTIIKCFVGHILNGHRTKYTCLDLLNSRSQSQISFVREGFSSRIMSPGFLVTSITVCNRYVLYMYNLHRIQAHINFPEREQCRPSGMSLLTLNESETKKTRPKNSYIGRILVKGYNTQLSHDDVESSLRKLFSSCGEITDVYIGVLANNTLRSFGFVYFRGEGAVDKALQLSGRDMGGWNVIADPHPFPKDADCCPVVAVQGYDTSLSKTDIKKVLTTHFSSCGEVTEIRIHKRIGAAAVYVYGECAEEKVLGLDGSYIGEHQIIVKLVSARRIYTVHPRRRHRCPFPVKKAKMTSEE